MKLENYSSKELQEALIKAKQREEHQEAYDTQLHKYFDVSYKTTNLDILKPLSHKYYFLVEVDDNCEGFDVIFEMDVETYRTFDDIGQIKQYVKYSLLKNAEKEGYELNIASIKVQSLSYLTFEKIELKNV